MAIPLFHCFRSMKILVVDDLSCWEAHTSQVLSLVPINPVSPQMDLQREMEIQLNDRNRQGRLQRRLRKNQVAKELLKQHSENRAIFV